MKVDITIEFDKELVTTIKGTVREFSEGLKNLQANLDKSDSFVSIDNISEPKPKKTKPALCI